MDPTPILQGLQITMENLASAISNQELGHIANGIKSFDGEPQHFKEWMRSLEKYISLYSLNDSNCIKMAFISSKGAVSDFIFRWQNDLSITEQNWEKLKTALSNHFAQVTDAEHAHLLLRQIKQRAHETVTMYSERLYNIARDAYANTNATSKESKAIIEKQLISYFIDGLVNDSIKMKIMRENPSTVDQALKIAIGEQNLRKRFALRNSKSFNENRVEREGRIEIPMEVDHSRSQRCTICQKMGHKSFQCRKRQVNSTQEIRCYSCGKVGHKKYNCRSFPSFDAQEKRETNNFLYKPQYNERRQYSKPERGQYFDKARKHNFHQQNESGQLSSNGRYQVKRNHLN